MAGVQSEGDLKAIRRGEFQDQVTVAGSLPDLPAAKLLHEARRAIGEPGVERRLQHAWQCHQQAGDCSERQRKLPRLPSVPTKSIRMWVPPSSTAQAESCSP